MSKRDATLSKQKRQMVRRSSLFGHILIERVAFLDSRALSVLRSIKSQERPGVGESAYFFFHPHPGMVSCVMNENG